MWSGVWLPWGGRETAGSPGTGHTTGGWRRRWNVPCMLTSWPPTSTEDWDLGSNLSAHIVLIWISCVQVNTVVKKLKICLCLGSFPFNLKIFIRENIPSKSVFQSWRKRSYRLYILPSKTLFSIFCWNMNIICFLPLKSNICQHADATPVLDYRISPYTNHSGESTWTQELLCLVISPGSTHCTLLNLKD